MRAGRLRHRIRLEERRDRRAEDGSSDPQWAPMESRWADIRPASARTLEAAAAIQSRVTHEIRIRYCPGLSARGPNEQPRHRAVEARANKDRIFSVESVLDVDERHAEQLLLAVEEA